MSRIYSLADMLTRIRNAKTAGQVEVTFPRTKLKEDICRLLKREHFIKDYEGLKDNQQGKIKVTLAYGRQRQSLINGLRCISRPGLRQYLGYKDLNLRRRRPGLIILSTPKGIKTDRECFEEKVGGEVLCEVW